MNYINFTKEDVKKYLDDSIKTWREKDEEYSIYYIDAFQSVRFSLFGEGLPLDD